jgi:ABC-2 type transport system permease protein
MNAVAYLRFELAWLARNPGLLISAVAVPAGLYALQATTPNGDIGGIPWPLFFLGSMTAYAALTAALYVGPTIAVERSSGWIHQLRVTPLPAHRYVATKVITSIILALPAAAILLLEGALFTSVKPVTALLLMAALVVGVLPFAGLAVAIGYLISPRAIQVAMTGAVLGLSFLGGLFMPVPSLPGPLQPLVTSLPSHHLAQLCRAIVAGNRTPLRSVGALLAWAAVAFTAAAWLYRRDELSATSAM